MYEVRAARYNYTSSRTHTTTSSTTDSAAYDYWQLTSFTAVGYTRHMVDILIEHTAEKSMRPESAVEKTRAREAYGPTTFAVAQ